jgi:glycosyltransferase involved in cell wall biosynthesis
MALAAVVDRSCADGVLLACRPLARQSSIQRMFLHYGIVESSPIVADWSQDGPLVALLGGTVGRDTGACTLEQALKAIAKSSDPVAALIKVRITGKGDAIGRFEELQRRHGLPEVIVHGRLTDAEYTEVLERSQVGLALKPISGALADTTFPSKVLELASKGLLVISTNVSDVKQVMGDGALYLNSNDPLELAALLRWAATNREEARAVASAGHRTVATQFSGAVVAVRIAEFLFP